MAEKEYIEREKVLALQTDLHFDNIEQLKHWKCRHIDPTDVELLPASDVRPVVHGHWITEEEAEERGNYSLRDACSVCGHCDWDCTESESFNYCPNCGAKMEEI